MSNETYPCMLYRVDDAKDNGVIVHDRTQYLAMGGYSDPFGIRGVEEEEIPIVEPKKPGRKPKVQA